MFRTIGICLLVSSLSGSTSSPQAPNAQKVTATDRRITFSAPAMPAGKLISLLSEKTGLKLECAPAMSKDVLLLEVRDRPIDEVLRSLARADSAEWLETKEGLRFTRSAALAVKLQKDEIAAVESGLREKLGPLFSSLATPLALNGALDAIRKRTALRAEGSAAKQELDAAQEKARELELRKLDSLNPDLRLMARCLREVGLTRIAAMKRRDRVVFSTEPTAMQKGLQRALEFARQHRREAAVWREAKRRLAPTKPKTADDEEVDDDEGSPPYGALESISREASDEDLLEAAGGPAGVVVTIASNGPASFGITVRVLNSRNEQLLMLESSSLLDGSPDIDSVEPEGGWKGPKVEFSHLSRLLAVADGSMQPVRDPSDRRPLDPELVRALTHPETDEPLDLFPADGFRSAARAKQLSVAVCLDDGVSYLGFYESLDSGYTVDAFLAEAASQMAVSVGGDWIVGGPRFPMAAQEDRGDRDAAGAYLRETARERKDSIDAEAALLASMSIEAVYNLIYRPHWILTGSRGMPHMSNSELLALYGSLSSVQRDRLASGLTVSYGSLSIPQRRLAMRAVYGASDESLKLGAEPPAELGALKDEPTVLAPNGLLPRCGVRARRTMEQWVYLIDPTQNGRPRRYALIRDRREGIPDAALPQRRPPEGGFEALMCDLRTVNKLHVEADICPWRAIAFDYYDLPQGVPGGLVPPAKLPEELRKRVEEAIRAYRGNGQ